MKMLAVCLAFLAAFYCIETSLSAVAAPARPSMSFAPPFLLPPPHPHTSSPSPPPPTTISFTDNTSKLVTQDIHTSTSQCSFGRYSLSSSNRSSLETTPGLLYVDFVQSSPCTGAIEGWNVCFWIKSDSAITFLVIRKDKERRIYNIVSANTLDVIVTNHSSTSVLSPDCEHFIAEKNVFMETGDYLGFVCHDSLHIALVHAQGGENTTRVYQSHENFMSLRNGINSNLSSLISIQEELLMNFKDGSEGLIPLVQVFFSQHGGNATVNATERPCSKENIGPMGLFKTIEFLSVVIAASVIIVVLTCVILSMGCCLCQLNCCSEVWHYCCQRKERVTHIVQVEPHLFEQSMLYNEMYVSSNPTGSQHQSMQKSSHTQVTPNPAYSHQKSRALRIGVRDELCSTGTLLEMTSSSNCNAGTEAQSVVGSVMSQSERNMDDLEHTYESINL